MLLFDENISYRVLKKVKPLFPGSVHADESKLSGMDDMALWHYAKSQQLAIITKDQDFINIWERLGAPPKVIWLQTGNTSYQALAEIITRHQPEILVFLAADSPAECMHILA